MKKSYDEDIDYHLNISKQLRERSLLSLKKEERYEEIFKKIESKIKKQMDFILRAIDEPVLFFTDTKKNLETHQNILYHCIDRNGKGSEDATIHDFQVFVGQRLNTIFQVWLKENDLNVEAHIQIRNGMSFPSSYAIYVGELEIYQFDIFKKKYTNQLKAQTEDDILQSGKKNENMLIDQIKHYSEEIESLVKMRQSLLKSCKTFSDYWHVLFKRKLVNEKLDLKQEKLIANKHRFENKLQKIRNSLPQIIEMNKQRETYLRELQPFFESFGYTYEPKYLSII